MWQTQTLIVNQLLNCPKKPDIYNVFTQATKLDECTDYKAWFQTSTLSLFVSLVLKLIYMQPWVNCKYNLDTFISFVASYIWLYYM